jgi:hypothetical protein
MPELRLTILAIDYIKRFSEKIKEQKYIISFDSQDNKEELATTSSLILSTSSSEKNTKTFPS